MDIYKATKLGYPRGLIDMIVRGSEDPVVQKDLESLRSSLTQMLEKKELIKKSYFYLITFTVKPSFTDYDTVRDFVKSQAQRKALKFKQFYFSEEKHKSGVPHWHCAVQTEKPLKRDRFNFYVRKYGHVDVSRTNVQTIQESLNYISKDTEPERLL